MFYVIPGNGHMGSGFSPAGAKQRKTRNARHVTCMDLHKCCSFSYTKFDP